MSGVLGASPSPLTVCYSRFCKLSFPSVSVGKGLLLTQGGVAILLKDLGITLVHNEDKFWNDEITR